ncbi:4-alpha-glucanotransferase [Aliiruegeria haliotis]|uniref:4-alpha-glucanotransferase n=1 Tax=Aliiruegeria haliotis TaxID=1280846 RepID=A0A2T0RXZ5_9RHOB|nr:4-alpha-glucanotransferase [Aliiruegeria haliotis]PRY26059.1 4-alpha-glucanotransferase [Aliiruegeria haliotis]
MTSALKELAHLAGIHHDYWDQTGTRVETSEATARALLAAMNLPAATDAEAETTLARFKAAEAARPLPRWLILEPGEISRHPLSHEVLAARLRLEDGIEMRLHPGETLTLPELPLGIHHLDLDGHGTTLLVAPRSLPLPERNWGVTLPLYGLRTPKEGGLGDYADLANSVRAIGKHGASFVGLNPVHAGFPNDPNAFSPYSPSHRRRLATIHIAVPGQRLNSSGTLIDYPGTVAAHREAMEAAFAKFDAGGGNPAFDDYVAREGASLRRFATYQALADVHGPYWGGWPETLRDFASPEVAAFRDANADAVRFHAWLQWMAETQLAEVAAIAKAAGMRYGLYLDLAVGTHPHGAETWSEGPSFASGVSLGAPPDAFSPDGQVWALAPFNPHALAEMGFRPFAETIRKQFRFAGLLRIDHVLGFERAFWAPDDRTIPGAYVAMPRDALLAIVRIEASRVGAAVVGEDLGNIPDGLQAALAESGILGCRVAMFEQQHHGTFRPPEDYTEAALASFGTHDLPTWRGWRSARDVTIRHELGILNDTDHLNGLDWRKGEVEGFDRIAENADDDPDAMHRFLGNVKSRLVAIQLEDLLGLVEQANLPGTVEVHPNWRRRLPVAVTELADHPALPHVAQIMKETGRQE